MLSRYSAMVKVVCGGLFSRLFSLATYQRGRVINHGG